MKVKSPETKTGKSDATRKVSPRNRIKYTSQQLHRLEKVFLSSQYPDSSILEDLSNTLNIDSERLAIWFQNRRSKFKRQSKGNHVNWMRQQLYQQGTAQSRDIRTQPREQTKEKCHVLSPPVDDVIKKEDAVEKPRSNLHYMPATSIGYPQSQDYDSASGMMPSSMFPSVHAVYSALNDAVSNPDNINAALQLSHLVNEMNSQQPSPSPFPMGGYSYPTGSSYYHQSYPPYYGYQSGPASYPGM